MSPPSLLRVTETNLSSYRRLFSTSIRRQEGGSLPRPRLDYNRISENSHYKSHNAFNRRANIPVNTVKNIVKLHQEHTTLQTKISQLKHQRGQLGERVKSSENDRAAVVEEAKKLKTEIHEVEARLAAVSEDLLSQALLIPNDTHPDVPLGPEEAAITLSTIGPTPTAASPARDHITLNQTLQFMDLEAGSVSSGSSWYFLQNEGALLEMALANYAVSIAIKHGFTPVLTPDVVKEDVATRCGFQPRDEANAAATQNYYLQRTKEEPQLVLSGTAEIPLAAMFAEKVFEHAALPRKVVGLGRAFRAEAGARGADTRGLYRVHQFSKVELFVVCEGAESEKQMENMRQLQTEIFQSLGLTFRTLDMPTEELGASAFRKYDIEAWMPGRGSWGEISSLSNCTDFQSRRLHIRHKPRIVPGTDASDAKASGLPFAHTLNGTAAAIPRLILALIENGARFDDGNKLIGLDLPSVLKPFWIGSEAGLIRWV